jgi:hypothetical protein
MGKKILIVVGVLVGILAVFAVVVAMQPAKFQVQRSATMKAPTEVVFSQVNDFHNWNDWSPWAKLDPNCKYTFEGTESGKGAIFKWDGNDKVGAGQMTILESKPNELVKMDLRFIRPFQDVAITEFSFTPKGDDTAVTWTMSGEQNFMEKAMCMFMNMDKILGGDFEKGLASIKAKVENSPSEVKPTEDKLVEEKSTDDKPTPTDSQ